MSAKKFVSKLLEDEDGDDSEDISQHPDPDIIWSSAWLHPIATHPAQLAIVPQPAPPELENIVSDGRGTAGSIAAAPIESSIEVLYWRWSRDVAMEPCHVYCPLQISNIIS